MQNNTFHFQTTANFISMHYWEIVQEVIFKNTVTVSQSSVRQW